MSLSAEERRSRKAERRRQFRQENPEVAREYNRQWRAKNLEKARAQGREWARKNPARIRAITQRKAAKMKALGIRKPPASPVVTRRASLKKYGLTPEGYSLMAKAQGGKCAICAESPTKRGLFVDHCHTTGKVRQLLCQACNLLVGFYERGGELDAVAAYVMRHKSPALKVMA